MVGFVTLEDSIRSIVREVVREELASLSSDPVALLDAERVGEKLGVDKQTVYRMVREGALRPVWISEHRFKIHPNELDRFIREGGVKTLRKRRDAA